MSFFQNVFNQEFHGYWVLGDRQASLTFKVPAQVSSSDLMLSHYTEPYDLSGDANLTVNYAYDESFKQWSALAINVAGSTPAATTAAEIVAALNANVTFSEHFVASTKESNSDPAKSVCRVLIRGKKNKTNFRSYISNSGAEAKLRFNRKAGVADIPKFFEKHTLDNRYNYVDSQGCLIRLTHPITAATVAGSTSVTSTAHGLTSGDVIYIVNSNSTPTIDGERTVTVTGANTFTVPVTVTVAGTSGEWLSAIEYTIVTDAGLDYSAMKEDWELLRGRCDLFEFQKLTVDGSSRITQIIQYPAGAQAGDFAKKTVYTYTAAQTAPDTITQIPYILTSNDLIIP